MVAQMKRVGLKEAHRCPGCGRNMRRYRLFDDATGKKISEHRECKCGAKYLQVYVIGKGLTFIRQ